MLSKCMFYFLNGLIIFDQAMDTIDFMFATARYLFSVYSRKKKEELSFEEAMKMLEAPEENVSCKKTKNELLENNTFSEFKGTITELYSGHGTIDDKYFFDCSPDLKLEVGEKVRYFAYKIDGVLKVTKIVKLHDNDWDDEQPHFEKLHFRRIIGSVYRKEGRKIYIEPNDLICDLNKVSSEFVPIKGDWVEVHALVESNEKIIDFAGDIVDILKVSPLRATILSDGIIKSWDTNFCRGIINQNVMFSKEACDSGYVPNVGDKVVAEIIESNQGPQTWRALKIVPALLAPKSVDSLQVEDSQPELLKNKNGIVISDGLCFTTDRLGERTKFAVSITNESEKPHKILYVRCQKSRHLSQIEILSPKTSYTNVVIAANEELHLDFEYYSKSVGISKELILFGFGGFEIGRFVHMSVQMTDNNTNGYSQKKRRQCVKNAKNSLANTSEYISGTPLVKTPAFIANRLPQYNIPQSLWNTILDEDQENVCVNFNALSKVQTYCPAINNNLSIENYAFKLHTLLFLEEIETIVSLRKYDIDRTLLMQNGDYLLLEVENLAERRPSVIVGDKVIVTELSMPNSPKREGVIHKVTGKYLCLKFTPEFHESYRDVEYAIEFKCSRTSFRRSHQAIDLAAKHLGGYFLFPSAVKTKDPQLVFKVKDESTAKPKSTENFINLCQQFHKSKAKNSPEKLKSHVEKGLSDESFDSIKWFDKKLNRYQKEAIRNIVRGEARPLPYIIFGPPGTGKTVTLVETILQILNLVPGSRLLVATPSNSAADLLANRLLDSNALVPGDMVRLVAHRCVAEGSIPERLRPFCATGDLAREGSRQIVTRSNGDGILLGQSSSVLGRHRVTVGTCSALGQLYNMGFSKGHFTHVLIDEAGQATEPEVLIPLTYLDVSNGQCVLAGDPLQLGPVVLSTVAGQLGLSESFLERMLGRFPYQRDPDGFPDSGGYDPRLITRLIYNYRTHPEILSLANNLFYDSELIPMISDKSGEEIDLLKRVTSLLPERGDRPAPAFVFHGVVGENQQAADCPSWYNLNEAAQVFFYLNLLYENGVKSEQVGIVSPYVKQAQLIRSFIYESKLDVPKIGSIEEFQGQECMVVILSTVRSSGVLTTSDVKHSLGFVASPRRLNVALTRARALLIIVGNPALLQRDPYWRNVLKYAIEIGAYTGCALGE